MACRLLAIPFITMGQCSLFVALFLKLIPQPEPGRRYFWLGKLRFVALASCCGRPHFADRGAHQDLRAAGDRAWGPFGCPETC